MQTPLSILIVENHLDTLKYLKMYLEQDDHVVYSARSIAEALSSFRNTHCDVLISDIGLPDGSGWDLLSKINLIKPVFAIAMSGFGMNSDQLKSQHAGFRHHLLKPFLPEQLEVILRVASEEKQVAAQV